MTAVRLRFSGYRGGVHVIGISVISFMIFRNGFIPIWLTDVIAADGGRFVGLATAVPVKQLHIGDEQLSLFK